MTLRQALLKCVSGCEEQSGWLASDELYFSLIKNLRDEKNWPLQTYDFGHFHIDHKNRVLEVTLLDRTHGRHVTIPYEEYEQALMQLALQGEA